MAKKKIKDPHAEREAKKYENPIPSREYIQQYLKKSGKPMDFQKLLKALRLTDKDQQEALRRRLRAMERDGQLVKNRRGGYGLIEKMDLLQGRVIGHRDGYGFIKTDHGKEDLFLSPRQMRTVFHDDVVLARMISVDRRGRAEGQVVEVLERHTQQVVGRFIKEGGIGFVSPDNKRITKDILIPPEHQSHAKENQIVVATIIAQPSLHQRPLGKITEILGEHMAPGMEIDIALRSHALPYVWPEFVLEEIKEYSETVLEQDKTQRLDYRTLPFVTIDGEDARDFDDAVYCKPHEKSGWQLYVAIADVSHYVKPKSALDEEAYQRGNSVYFPGETIPMLPEILSNGLCSLKPNVDRLAVVCEMTISKEGELKRYCFNNAVIQSKARLTYTQVAHLIEDHKNLNKEHKILEPHLNDLHALYKVLHERREQRGAIDFDTTETRFIFDKEKKIKSIVPLKRNVAHRIIEECMLLANVSTAKFLKSKKIPLLYRIHETPAESKIKDLRTFLTELGLKLHGGKKPRSNDYVKVLNLTEKRKDAHLIQTVMLRSLSQAVYSPDNIGHFGLAYSAYTHFTSPIRRYPDLLVHRAIKHVLKRQASEKFMYSHEQMVEFGKHCSTTERRADEATRDVEDWLKCEFIEHRLGEVFDGIISSVTGFGLFIELQNIYVEGLVHVTGLKNDYYHFDPIHHRLIGEKTGVKYRLGDSIRVRVVRVDLDERQIDFELVD